MNVLKFISYIHKISSILERENKNISFIPISSSLFLHIDHFLFLLHYSSLSITSCFFFILLPVFTVQFYRPKLPLFPIIVRIVAVRFILGTMRIVVVSKTTTIQEEKSSHETWCCYENNDRMERRMKKKLEWKGCFWIHVMGSCDR